MIKKISILSGYLVVIHTLLIVILVKSNFIELIVDRVTSQQNEFSHYYHTMVALHFRVDQNVAENSSLFIGDSLTQGLAVNSIIDNAINYGIGNDTTLGVLNRLPYYQSVSSSKFIVLAIGLNDFKYRGVDEIIANFCLILEELSSANHVILSSLLPVDEAAQSYINNNKIIQLNKALSALSQRYNNVSYMDVNISLSIAGGLPSAYHIGDGIHLNQAGNHIWINLLKERLDSYE